MEDWTEKYRPKSLADIVGNERAIIEIRKWAETWNKTIPKKRALILSGKPGTGKTSCAISLAKDFNWAMIELNTSDSRNASKIKSVATSGAVNESFDEQGRFISSKNGGRKLIILDEADNLFEKIEGGKSTSLDLSDKGGKKAIVDTVKITGQPIILIVNDYYGLIKGSGESLKDLCKLIRFHNPYSSQISNLLKKISTEERTTVDPNVIQKISERCKGDIRSAVNDLQSICLNKTQVDANALDILGYRDREKIIFDGLREIFKTRNIQVLKQNLMHLDQDPESLILWINENLPKEYLDFNDLVKAYDALSKADVFLGRTRSTQNYQLWGYACDIMNGGVATSKSHDYPNEKYNFPMWLREHKRSKSYRDVRDSITEKINKESHNSKNKSKDFLQNFFIPMFRNNMSFAFKMKQKYDFTESELKYLLGDEYSNKIKQLIRSSESQVIIKEIEEEAELKDEKESKETEIKQPSLFDF